jgi:glycosyltransferase involved in cell wall biosynthesis
VTTLSVVIPTYNRGALVSEAIESVLSQDAKFDIEIIVVDDGSQDDTPRVLESFGSRVRAFRQSNRGMNSARNAGIKKATGKYVALLDSDDVWLPFKAALQVQVMEQLDSVGFSFSDFFSWRNDERNPNGLGKWMLPGMSIEQHATLRTFSDELGAVSSAGNFGIFVCEIFGLSLYQPVVLPSTVIVRREAFAAIGPLPEDNDDWAYFARVSRRFGAAYLDVETALNRSHDDEVRLMRRDLAVRTKQRLQSIHDTWRAEPDFMAHHADDVARIEAREWTTLFKRACLERNFGEGREHLARIKSLLGVTPFRLWGLYLFMLLPGSQTIVKALRS